MKNALLVLILFSPILSFTQGVNNLWLLGYPGGGGGINMNFNSGVLNISSQIRKMDFEETNGEICDVRGNILFYSNGVWIANPSNDTMFNGSGLNPSAFTKDFADINFGLTNVQGNLIIPFPDDTSRYYLFHTTCDDYPGTFASLFLYYSVIDMRLDNGRGAVIDKNHVLLNDSLLPDRMTACKHANGRDWWLVNHQHNSNLYYKYLITPFGIQGPYTQSIGGVRPVDGTGQSVFSPDGRHYAYSGLNNLDIFDFDRCTGDFIFREHTVINDSAFTSGAAFSPNSQVLYVCYGYGVYQFDMNAANIAASKTRIMTWDASSTTFFLSQLAPDGKIYINTASSDSTMHVVNNPDVLGIGCNPCRDCIALPALNAFTIPNHPNYFLDADTTASNCVTSIQFQNTSDKHELKAFPNPVSTTEEITFIYPSSGEHRSINIYNIEGKQVMQHPIPQWSSIQRIRLPQLSKGIYMASLTGDNNKELANTKFIVE